jgi:hypothetical protein
VIAFDSFKAAGLALAPSVPRCLLAGKEFRHKPARSNSSSSSMPHFICRWPGGDVLLASVESRQELDAILQVGTTDTTASPEALLPKQAADKPPAPLHQLASEVSSTT